MCVCIQIKQKAKVDKLQDRSLAYSLEVVPETNVFLGVKKKIAPNALCKSCPVSSMFIDAAQLLLSCNEWMLYSSNHTI